MTDYDRDIQRQRLRLDQFKETMGFMVDTFGMDADDRVFYKTLARKALLDPYAVQLGVPHAPHGPAPAAEARAANPLVRRTARIALPQSRVPLAGYTPPSLVDTASDGDTEPESDDDDAPPVVPPTTERRGAMLSIASVCKARGTGFGAGMRLAVRRETAVLWRSANPDKSPHRHCIRQADGTMLDRDVYFEGDRALIERAIEIVRARIDPHRPVYPARLHEFTGAHKRGTTTGLRFREQKKQRVGVHGQQ